MGEATMTKAEVDVVDLPPGFRFHPTDEELISYYLTQKIIDGSFTATAIAEADFNKCEPWDLAEKGKNMGEKEWYFFSHRDRKYPTGTRTNRATESGYWKATGKDKQILKVGMKKTLVFYSGRAPKGRKTNWIMHEYRLHRLPPSAKEEWVVCRVFEKKDSGVIQNVQIPTSSSIPALMDPTNQAIVHRTGFDDHHQSINQHRNYSHFPTNSYNYESADGMTRTMIKISQNSRNPDSIYPQTWAVSSDSSFQKNTNCLYPQYEQKGTVAGGFADIEKMRGSPETGPAEISSINGDIFYEGYLEMEAASNIDTISELELWEY